MNAAALIVAIILLLLGLAALAWAIYRQIHHQTSYTWFLYLTAAVLIILAIIFFVVAYSSHPPATQVNLSLNGSPATAI